VDSGVAAPGSRAAEVADAGPATEPVAVVDAEESRRAVDGFLHELRRAVDEENPLGPPDAQADAAMRAFFDRDGADDGLPKRSRFGRKR
jgi:hypothetical protein